MEKFDYIIILVSLLIVGAGVYIHFFYVPAISVSVSFAGQKNVTLFTFEPLSFPIIVNNTGSAAVRGMGMAIDVNGQLNSYYNLTIPAGKEATLYFNTTLVQPGEYNISAVADPGRLYNIMYRNAAQDRMRVDVIGPAAPSPGAMVPLRNATSVFFMNSTYGGLAIMDFIDSGYALNLSGSVPIVGDARVLMPLLNISGAGISRISAAYSYFGNGSSVYALWISGPAKILELNRTESLLGLNVSTTGINGTEMLFAADRGSTLCSWYSEGWLKTIVGNGISCKSAFAEVGGSINESGYPANITYPQNSVVLGNYYIVSAAGHVSGIIVASGGQVLLSRNVSHMPYAVRNPLCYGTVSGNGSYCNYYITPGSGAPKNLSLIGISSENSTRNATIFALMNTTHLLEYLPGDAEILSSYGMKNVGAYTSLFADSCTGFGNGIVCSNMSFYNSTAVFNLTNENSGALYIHSASCYSTVPGLPGESGMPLVGGTSAVMHVKCYDGANVLESIPLGLTLTLQINYTAKNATQTAYGSANVFVFS